MSKVLKLVGVIDDTEGDVSLKRALESIANLTLEPKANPVEERQVISDFDLACALFKESRTTGIAYQYFDCDLTKQDPDVRERWITLARNAKRLVLGKPESKEDSK